MERFFKRLPTPETLASSPNSPKRICTKAKKNPPQQSSIEVDLNNIIADPGLRPRIQSYHPNVRDQVRRVYLQRGPCQPQLHNFRQTLTNGSLRRFIRNWYDEYPTWLEYSESEDAAYCLCCFLFRPDIGGQSAGDVFVGTGFIDWRNKSKLDKHVGKFNSSHSIAWRNCESLLNQKEHITTIVSKHNDQDRCDYRIRLCASIGVVRLLLHQGLPFRGHDESEDSDNQGNFLEILNWLCEYNDGIKAVTLKNAPDNLKLTSPDIQKDIVSAISTKIIQAIINDIGDSLFAILVDESRDMANKEQMAIVLRYVKHGRVIERFVGIEHVMNTNATTLKHSIDDFFSRHGLSISRLRGQGYDGASNMKGQFNGLKALILKDNECAFYVHCFAHQLQLSLIAVAKKHETMEHFFTLVTMVVNVIGASPKRLDLLRDYHAKFILEAIHGGNLSSGRGQNQETNLKRACDTRWSSHFNSLLSLVKMFSSVMQVLKDLKQGDGMTSEQKFQCQVLLDYMQSFDFIFCLHVMKKVLGVTYDLSQSLQKKDQDIVNALNLVTISKGRLQTMRDTDWDHLLGEVFSFCEEHCIETRNMDDEFRVKGKPPKRNAQIVTNMHHYRVELFYNVIDVQLQELNNRFNEKNTELLLCVACLNPSNYFSSFDKEKLVCLAKFYPSDFSEMDIQILEEQLENYIMDMRSNDKFSKLHGISDLAQMMVDTKKDKTYALVYLLLTLALILPVATASVERVFSAMNIVKTRLRNRMGDEWMNGCLTAYIEKKIFDSIDDEAIIHQFQNMKLRRMHL